MSIFSEQTGAGPGGSPEGVALARVEKQYHEINVLKIEGRCFSFASRKNRSATLAELAPPAEDEILRQLEVNGFHQEGAVWSTPNPIYGQPGELAYKAFQVILKKVSDIGPAFDGSINFSYLELAAMCGRASIGGKDLKELYRAIDQLLTTQITCAFYNKRRTKWRVFKFSLLIGEEYETSAGDTNRGRGSVMLHPYVVASLREKYFFSLNYERLRQLPDALSQALFKRLHFHFANLFQHHSRESFPPFVKSYEVICRDWFSGLTPLTNRKHILNRQLGKHLDRLREMGVLASYDIEKNSQGTGFNFKCTAGPAFFDDYARLNAGPVPPAAQQAPATPEIELLAYFYEKKYGEQAGPDGSLLAPVEVDFARQLLAKHPPEECRTFIEFALEEAAKTKFDVRLFAGLRQYHAPFAVHLRARTKRKAADEARRARETADGLEQRLIDDYQAFRRDQLDRIRERMDHRDLERFEAEATAHEMSLRKTRIGLPRMVQIRVDERLAQDNALPSFDEWRKENASTAG